MSLSEPRTWMKEPCGPCPYSRSKTLWLHPERAEDFANMASNPYTDFPCHKTALEVDDGECGTEYVAGERSLTCCGFLSLQVSENGRGPEGFKPHPDAFDNTWEMIDQHTEHWEADRERRRQPASVDTLPKGQDAQQGLAGTESGAVPRGDEADAQHGSNV